MGKNKRPVSYYKQFSKRPKRSHNFLGPNMAGFLCMCNGQEKRCVQEAYSILSEFANELYGKEECKEKEEDKEENTKNEDREAGEENAAESKAENDSDSEEELDMEAALKAEVSQLQKSKTRNENHKRRFQQVECGAQNCIFIRTTLEDPVQLSLAVMDSILETRQQRTQKLIRMIPVQKTCKAFPKDIEKAVETLAETFLKDESKKYYIAYKIRNNSSIKRDDLTKPLIDIIQGVNSKNCPDLEDPDVVINIDVIKGVCCLSILPGYFDKYSKYNLVEMAKNKQRKTDSTAKTNIEESSTKEVNSSVGNDNVEKTGVKEVTETMATKNEDNGNGDLDNAENAKGT